MHGYRHGMDGVMVRISLYDVEFTGFQSARYQPVVQLFAEPDYPEGDMQIERQYHNEILDWSANHALREVKDNFYLYGHYEKLKGASAKIVSQYIKYLLSDDLVAESVVSAIDLLSSPAYTEDDVTIDLEVSAQSPDERMPHYAINAVHDIINN